MPDAADPKKDQPASLRVAQMLGAAVQGHVDQVEALLASISAPPQLRVVVLEELGRMAMKAAGRFKERRHV